MLERWKSILLNWNNCYFSDSNKNEAILDLESLLNIISHLRENLNLDESKSSALEAHTVNEFIEEKYPGFKFENGTVEPTNEDEIYLVASLLLFFVCVNSKDVDIKNAMCSKLSSEDQKTILKFSKCLMECPEIGYSDVKAAITEACGQDLAVMEVSPRPIVAETPPALRSLHSEVRRLQAALDAERFDRNYLQEELNRTNLRVEKLLKEKAQHKLDIVNLKAKISLCGLETESKDADTAADRSAKLARQLQQIEDKLVETQAQLDDSVYERDVYKKKVEDLKRERDKYLSLSQSEAARVSQLSEELDTERHHVQTLKDLITELKQHNRLNRMDSSLLECDDPDASIQSLPHNSSICSEACANVVEVQLGEERAKIVVLKQQIQSLQDQLNELTTKTESERKTLQNVISDRENNIFNLKHCINEEIEEKNNIKAYYDNEMTKLNNDINELEQKLKDNSEHSRSMIERKIEEIQTLQEEKLSLLHSLNNETTKLENIIKDLQNDLESEKQNKSIMKENYETHIMKLNEKVLNRNNELVELQNSVFEKGEVIETLQIELRKEKEAKEELTKQYQELNKQKRLVENDLQQKCSNINELQMKLQRNNTIIEDMKSELFDLHKSISELNDKCKILEDAREVLLTDVKNRDIRIENALKEIEDITNKFSKENGKLKLHLDEQKATVHSLQTQLKNEIEFKMQLQHELDNLNSSLQQATVLNEQLNKDLSKMKTDIQNKDKTIDAMDLYLQEEKKLNSQANERFQKLTNHVVKKEKEINSLKEEVAIINDSFLKQIQTNKENVEIAKNKLLCEIAEKESLQMQVKSLEEENVQMQNVIAMKCEEIMLLRLEVDENLQKVNERDTLIKYVEKQFINECKKYDQLEAKFEVHMAKVMKRFNEMGKFVVQTTDTLRNEIIEKESALQALNINLYQLRQEIDITNNDLANVKQDKDDLLDKLSEEMLCKTKLQEKYETQCNYLESLKLQFTKELKLLTDAVAEKSEGLNKLETELILERQNKKKLASEMNSIVKQLKDKVVELESLNNELEQELKYKMEHKNQIADINNKVTSTISAGYEKLMEILTQDNFKDIEVEKLEDDANSESMNNFKIIINIAESLINKVEILKHDIVSANSEVNKLNDFMVQKEAEVLNLKDKVKQLEDMVDENKKELATQSENYITSMNSKIKDIQTLQEENKYLHNDLNDVKLQLEVKVHSLKEKLVDNENVTDKLKTTYETQIDNLNVMVTTLTNYLKEKTIELEALRKDKENLLTTIADSCRVIKSLEEEVKSEKQNTDKMVSDFESERLVLKNMVTVTESVMEDQKLSLNNIIAEHLNTIEVLTEEIDKLKNNIKDYEAKFNSVEVINDSLRFMVRQEREFKIQVENESEIVREYLDEVIGELRNEKQLKAVVETEKRELLAEIERCKDDLDVMRETIRELKETNTTISEEVNRLLDNLNTITEERDDLTNRLTNVIAEKTELQSSLEGKTQLVTEFQTESKDLKDKLNELIKEKDDLVTKETSLINKIEEIKQINEEVIEMLKIENEQLVKTIDKVTNDLHETQKSHEELKQTLEDTILNLKEELANSNNEKTGFEILLAHKTQQLSYSETESKELKDKFNELIKEKIELIEDKNTYIDKLEEINQANVAKENEEIAKLKEVKEHLRKTVEEKNDAIEQLEQLIKTEIELSQKLRDDNEDEKNTFTNKCTILQEHQNKAEKHLEEREIEIDTLQKELTTLKTSIEKYDHDAKIKDGLISEITNENDAIVESLTQELSDKETKINTLQQELTDLKTSIQQDNNTKDGVISEITKEKDVIVKSLTQELSDKNTEISTLQQEVTNLKANVEQNNNKKDGVISKITKEKDAIIKSLTQEICDEKTKINSLQQELTDLKESIEQNDNKKDVLISEITNEKDVIITSLTQELSDKNTIINTLQQELTELKASTEKDNNTKDGIISEITKEKDAIINSLTQELSDKKTTISTLQQELTDLKASTEQDNNTKDGIISEITKEKDAIINSLTQELSDKKTTISTLQQELTDLKVSTEQDNNTKDGIISEITKEKDAIINSLTQELSDKKTTISTLQQEVTNLKANVEQNNNKKDGVISKITKEKDAIIKSLTQEICDEKTKINSLQQELTDLKESIEQNDNKKDVLISEITNEKDVIITSLTQELSDKNTIINTLQQELTDLKASTEQDNNTKDGIISEITKEKDAIINSLTQELSDKKTTISTLQQELTDLKASTEQDNNTKDGIISEITKEKDAIINSLTQELSDKKTTISTLQQELTDLKVSTEQDNNTKDGIISEITKEKDAIINSLTQELSDKKTTISTLQQELTNLKASTEQDNNTKDGVISKITKEKDAIINSLTQELSDKKTTISTLQQELTNLKASTEQDNNTKDGVISKITKEKDAIINSLTQELSDKKTTISTLQQELTDLKASTEQDSNTKDGVISEITKEKDAIINSLTQELSDKKTTISTLQQELTNLKTNFEQCVQENKVKEGLISEITKEKNAIINSVTRELSEEKAKFDTLQQENKAKDGLIHDITNEKDDIITSLTQKLSVQNTIIENLQHELTNLKGIIEQDKKATDSLISKIAKEKDAIINSLTSELSEEKTKINTIQTQLTDLKSSLEQGIKAKDGQISEIIKEKDAIIKELSTERTKINTLQQENKAKDGLISKMSKEKDAIINSLTQELSEAKNAREKSEKEANIIYNELKNNMEVRRALMKENDQLTQAVGQQETFAALCQEKAGGEKYLCLPERREFQVSTTSDTHSSIESLKTISDLEKIIHDKNRTITTLQSDITYMKTLMAESENKLLDVSKELEVTKENCQQLSNQLKKIVYQKNEEIAELRKQVNKMSATETRATQIIKVSAKYHAMILKRIAEIKTNTVLKELTNFGNTASDNELRRSLNAGTITMEELEHFLDTTDRHLKRCAEKQIALQKERDRLYEVNRINESEIINLKKFLNELSLSFQTFSSVKNLYAQKLSRVISVQRTVRREILNLEGRVTDAAMCKLERGYAAVMQDLAECAMNLERWVERCISRTVSVEKIKQAFTSDSERSSLSTPSFQNTGLEIQLEELEKSFQKLLEEVANVQGDGARETQATTVMEVRAQYEDKLNRMKAKMKELMSEQMSVLKDKQRAEIGLLERELQKTRDKMEEAKRGYETHIRELTRELWNVGEKYLVKTDEAEWLKRKQHSGSLMSLQHVHSSGLLPPQEPPSRPSDTHSLRSLPLTNNTNKREGRGLHMSDEEGEVFDNRFLKEITATPRREPAGSGKRLSELQFRNSLCPPHLKSSYPAETQFVPVLDEEEIKAGSLCHAGGTGGAAGKAQRKEVGITAYKKPGPPTPSKQAGRLSATDCELRESLRVEADPHPADRKTSTPARIRAFLSFKSRDTAEGTPRTRRLSYNIFRRK